MAKLGDIKTLGEKNKVDTSALPEQFEQRDPLPQPGRGVIIMLPHISPSSDGFLDLDEVKKVGFVFGGKEDPSSALRVVHHPSDPACEDGKFRWRVTNEEKSWDEEKGDASSSFAYLLRAADPTISLPEGSTNADYLNALLASGGRLIKASIDWNANCNPKKNIYVEQEDGSVAEQEGALGCGAYYALKTRTVKKGKNAGRVYNKIPNEVNPENGLETSRFAQRFTCAGVLKDGSACGASIGVFADLKNIQPLSEGDYKMLSEKLGREVSAPGPLEFERYKPVASAQGNGAAKQQAPAAGAPRVAPKPAASARK
jgi:hypothetical protein